MAPWPPVVPCGGRCTEVTASVPPAAGEERWPGRGAGRGGPGRGSRRHGAAREAGETPGRARSRVLRSARPSLLGRPAGSGPRPGEGPAAGSPCRARGSPAAGPAAPGVPIGPRCSRDTARPGGGRCPAMTQGFTRGTAMDTVRVPACGAEVLRWQLCSRGAPRTQPQHLSLLPQHSAAFSEAPLVSSTEATACL